MPKTKSLNADWLIKDMLVTSAYCLLAGVLAALVLVVLVYLLTPQVFAADSTGSNEQMPPMSVDQALRGSLILKLASGGVSVDAPMLNTDVEMDISGLTARVRVLQHFNNPSGDWVEGTYVFPLPENSAVDRMKLRIGERLVEGVIKEKEAARRTYETAKRAGKKASLLSQQRPNIFTTAVANIGPGEKVSVEIEYQQQLNYRDGQFSVRFPLVVAPRYIPGTSLGRDRIGGFSGTGWAQDTSAVPDASRITPPVIDESEAKINPVSIQVNLNAGFPLAELLSRYHAIESLRDEKGIHRIKLKAEEVPADRDFELVWKPKTGSAPHAAWFREQWQGEEYGLLMLMPPTQQAPNTKMLNREVVFVIDTSGSMHGASIVQAKSALRMAIKRLSATDRFNIIQFNHQAEQLFRQSITASIDNQRRALAYVDSMSAEGGTEMLPALQLALANQDESVGIRQVVFLTDGSVGNEQQLFSLIEKRLGHSRLFTIGIGSAPNSFFMRRAANFGRGSFTYISKIDEVEEKMRTLFGKLESPALTDIVLQMDDGDAVEIWPAKIPDLYLGEPVVLTMKFKQPPKKISLVGKQADRDWAQQVVMDGGAQSKGIHLLWARNQIADLMDQRAQGKSEAEVKQAVLAVALQHQLVSKYTSLVAVDKTPSRPASAQLKSKAMPTNLPKGWNQQKVFGQLPQTATSAPLQLLLGSLLSIIALLIIGWSLGWHRLVMRRASLGECRL